MKLANGNVSFQLWDEPGVKVDAKIKLYGKMDAAEPFDAFEARSQINVDDERISFQIPNNAFVPISFSTCQNVPMIMWQ